MKRYLNELGRSMVELLGVLAVIGVLTLGGLWGYNYAMIKHEANELVNEMNICSTIVSGQALAGVEPNFSECVENLLKKYNVEISEIYTYENESGEYFSFTLYDVPEEVLNELLKIKFPFPATIYVDGKEVINDKITLFLNNEVFIKKAMAEIGHTVTVEVKVNSDGTVTPPWDDCEGHEGGEKFCLGGNVVHCVGKGTRIDSFCYKPLQECVNAECKCLRTCGPEQTLNHTNCNCECPPDKPLQDGDDCKKRSCETAADCVGGVLGLFEDADEECMECINGLCKVKEASKPSSYGGHAYCEGETVVYCSETGKKKRVYIPCDQDITITPEGTEKSKCCDGKCIPEKECCLSSCQYGCCADGSCKPEPPDCCEEEKVDGCCPDDDECCPESCICGCD